MGLANDKSSFDLDLFKKQLQHPDWYIRLSDFLNTCVFPIEDNPEIKKERHIFYDLVTQLLEENLIPLAKEGPNFDRDRKPIDTIVIHHSDEDPHMKLDKLSAIGFIRQYGSKYLKGEVNGNNVKGQPVWSGHFKDGKMVFFAYHHVVFPNGKNKRLLEDKYIGWQSGDWDINTRSVAIVLAGDYKHKSPQSVQINAVVDIIKQNYPFVSLGRIFGHREINPKTTCPGDQFIEGWKNTLLEAARTR